MKLSRRGLAFWLAWGALGGAWELVTWLSGHDDLTLSWQVWWLVSGQPGDIRALEGAGFLAAMLILAVHLFGRRD